MECKSFDQKDQPVFYICNYSATLSWKTWCQRCSVLSYMQPGVMAEDEVKCECVCLFPCLSVYWVAVAVSLADVSGLSRVFCMQMLWGMPCYGCLPQASGFNCNINRFMFKGDLALKCFLGHFYFHIHRCIYIYIFCMYKLHFDIWQLWANSPTPRKNLFNTQIKMCRFLFTFISLFNIFTILT